MLIDPLGTLIVGILLLGWSIILYNTLERFTRTCLPNYLSLSFKSYLGYCIPLNHILFLPQSSTILFPPEKLFTVSYRFIDRLFSILTQTNDIVYFNILFLKFSQSINLYLCHYKMFMIFFRINLSRYLTLEYLFIFLFTIFIKKYIFFNYRNIFRIFLSLLFLVGKSFYLFSILSKSLFFYIYCSLQTFVLVGVYIPFFKSNFNRDLP